MRSRPKQQLQLPRAIVGLVHKLRRRHLLLPGILLVHVFVLMIAFLSPSSPIEAKAVAAPVSIFDVASAEASEPVPAPAPEVPEIVMPDPLIDLKIDMPALPAEPVFSAAAAEQAGFGKTCEVAATLARAFSENAHVRAELARIGPEARSVANAMLFWDGGWVEVQGRAPEDALRTLRRAIAEGIRAAPPECLAEDVVGPRFIGVDEGKSMMMLVLGSGTWRWEHLLADYEQEEKLAGRQPAAAVQ